MLFLSLFAQGYVCCGSSKPLQLNAPPSCCPSDSECDTDGRSCVRRTKSVSATVLTELCGGQLLIRFSLLNIYYAPLYDLHYWVFCIFVCNYSPGFTLTHSTLALKLLLLAVLESGALLSFNIEETLYKSM